MGDGAVGSQPILDLVPIKSEVVHVPMRDGAVLSVHVHRPDADGTYPAILSYTPYRQGRLGKHHPIVEHGYATVSFDIRGTGNSSGWNDSIYSAPERQDGYDMVEWAAAQPWCSGNVGMWGISFGAVAALQMAAAAPPHLKAIIARSGSDDPYTEWTNPGGSPRPYMYTCYAPIMTAANFSPPDPAELGERWAEVWSERLESNAPWGISFIRNLEDGAFWRERAMRGRYGDVRCAVFVVGGWADWYASPLLRIFSELRGPKRALIGPWSHSFPDSAVPGPRIDWLRESLRWFDYWLKGAQNGVMDEPPVTLFVRDYSQPATFRLDEAGHFQCEREWPIARRMEITWHLHRGGRLAPTSASDEGRDELTYDPRVGASAGMHGGGPFNVNWALPLDQRVDEVSSLVYTSEPLEQPIEIIGQPRVVLHFSSSAEVTEIVAKLCDVGSDGTSALVTKGYLNAARRGPYGEPTPLVPGEVTEVELELLACAYRFSKGHRVRLDIAAADFQNLWPTPALCVNSVYWGGAHDSSVTLPVVHAAPAAFAPSLLPSPTPDPQTEAFEPPTYTITRDLVEDTETVHFRVNYSPRWVSAASMTVSARNPACTVVEASSRISHDLLGRSVVVDARCITSSDACAFHHTVDVTITLNGQLHFSKSWSESVARRYM